MRTCQSQGRKFVKIVVFLINLTVPCST